MPSDPNTNRGPWCVVCGSEMNRTNHRFEVRKSGERLIISHYEGTSDADPVCGERCLIKKVSEWATEVYRT